MLIKKIKYILSIVCIVVVSCNKEAVNLYDNFNTERDIKRISEIPLKENLSIIGRMTMIDSLIIVQSYRSTHNFYVFNYKNGECINKIVSYGRANNESLWANMENIYDNHFTYYDINNNCVMQINKNDLLHEIIQPKRTKIIVDNNYVYGSDVTLLSGNRYLYTGLNMSKNTVFRITDTLSNLIADFGTVVLNKNDNNSKKVLPEAQGGKITTNKNNTYFLFSSSYGNIFKFYDCKDENKAPILIKDYTYDTPIYEEISGGAATSKDNILGVLSATSDDENNYYLLYQEKTIAEAKNIRKSNIILVFDANGKPIEKLKLDANVSNITYNKINNNLIGLYEDNEGNNIFIQFCVN